MIVSSGSSVASVGNARLLSRFAFTLSTLLLLGLPGWAGAQTTYNSTGGVSIADPTKSAFNTITVTGAPGTVASVQVQVNGIVSNSSSASSIGYTSFMLKGPNGQTFMLLGGAGDGYDNGGLNGVNVLFKDGAASAPGCTTEYGVCGSFPRTGSQTYEPTSFWYNIDQGAVPAIFAPPAVQLPQLDGTEGGYGGNSTFASVFNGGAANGGWQLILASGEGSGFLVDPVSVSSWSLTLTFSALVSTTTTVATNLNPSYTTSPSNSVTFTATVTGAGGTPTGTVAFQSNGTTISGCGGQPMSGGIATCATTLSSQGISTIKASYSGSSSYGSSNNSLTELVEAHQTVGSNNTWCNTGSILVPGSASAGSVYPSVIHVSGYPNGQTVSTVEVQLLSASGILEAQHLLVAPDGTHNLDFFDYGFTAISASGINLNFFDAAGQYTNSDSTASSGNYEASDNLESGNQDGFPSSTAPTIDSAIPQVPSSVIYGYNPYYPAEKGAVTNTLENEFNNAPANGDWALYPFQNDAEVETIGGGWCIQLTLNTGTPTATTVQSSKNPQTPQTSVTFTGTVTSSGNPVTSGGTVTFLDNGNKPGGTVSGNNVVTLNGSGQASFSTSGLAYTIESGAGTYTTMYEGDHNITADYSGSSLDNPSASGILWQRFDSATSAPIYNGSNSFSYCNASPVLSAQGNSGGFLPNPSNVFVTNLPGTVNTAGVTLKGLYTIGETSTNMQTMLAGPNNKGLDFFSDTGSVVSSTSFSTGNYTFNDNGAAHVPQISFTPGTYLPTDGGNSDAFTASKSGFYPLPGTILSAAPHGSSTFTTTFGGSGGNGTWSLFFNEAAAEDATGAMNGWCVNLTETPVSITTSLAHNGTGASGDFILGEQSAGITVSVQNNGTGTAGDPVGSNTNPLVVVDTLPTGLTYASGSGTGWTCAAVGQFVTCKNDAASVAANSSYNQLTINVNVAINAGHTLSNPVTVSGATTNGSSGSDTITVDPPASLSVAVSHTGNFTQGQNGTWNVAVSNTASGGATSGTITVTGTLPAGYGLVGSSASTGTWGCGLASSIVTCTSTSAINGGNSTTIQLTVSVATNSPTSVSLTAHAYGGGDPVHTSSGTAALSNTDTVTVIQVPASVALTTGNNQSVKILTAFTTPLEVTVLDAGSVAINGQSVTFTAPSTGATAFFSNSTTTITGSTNASGQISEAITSGNKVGAYSVTVQAGTISNSFNLTNLHGPPFIMTVIGGNNQSTFDTAAFGSPLVVNVTDAGSNPLAGATVTFTPPTSGATAAFAGGVNTATTDITGTATSAALTANNQVGGYTVSATSGTASTSFQLTNTVGPVMQLIVTAPSSAFTGLPIQFTVNALDAGNNLVSTDNDTLHFTSSDGAATLPADTALVGGAGTFAATLNTVPGPQTISATDTGNSIAGTSAGINVSTVPVLVVNVAADDYGTALASNCKGQTTPGTSTTPDNCSLRDALLGAANFGAANISFDSLVFNSATPINAASTLTIPAYTTINGLTSQVTVNGGGSGSNYPVFSVNAGVAGVTISNLNIVNGSSSSGGSGLTNAGAMAITNCTFSGNQATGGGAAGAIENTGTLTITGCTFANNSATGGGNGGA
ncbi:MAG TPA: Ig-like domain repeat protein, partial [Terracidiphilus sp.]|nr:Ig-like domain repeat protein [Terracidiphilus sp.]